MKTIFTFLFTFIISVTLFAQTATSVADGNWFLPSTWQGGVVPTPGYNVIINHHVVLSSNWGYNTGSVTISSTGSLIQDGTNRAFGQQGGSFSNAGTVTISKIGFLGGTITNSGTLNGTDSLYLGINLTNTGTITSNNFYSNLSLSNNNNINVTNFFNNGTFDNAGPLGVLNATNFFNNTTVLNSGLINFNNCTNSGTFTNNNGIEGSHDFTNAGIFYNNLSGYISIVNDCTNGDSINNNAHWYNNGTTLIGNDFTNADTLEGNAPGSFCVYNNSVNYGYVLGDFDFCDMLTTTFGINTGSISNGITYCQVSCWGGVKENITTTLKVFPNPATESFTIQFKDDLSENNIQIVNSCGQIVFEQSINRTDEITILRNSLPSGLYLLKISNDSYSLAKKFIFE